MRNVQITEQDGGFRVQVNDSTSSGLLGRLALVGSVLERMTVARQQKMLYGVVTEAERQAVLSVYILAAREVQRIVNEEETAAIVATRKGKSPERTR